MNTLNNRTNLVVQQSLRSNTSQLKASRDIMYFNTENLISQIIFKTWPDFNNQANQSSVVLGECFFYLTTYKWLGFMPRKESAVAKEHVSPPVQHGGRVGLELAALRAVCWRMLRRCACAAFLAGCSCCAMPLLPC